ncbi:hypothetical protein AAC387_Pa09g1826 [Persea americana]
MDSAKVIANQYAFIFSSSSYYFSHEKRSMDENLPEKEMLPPVDLHKEEGKERNSGSVGPSPLSPKRSGKIESRRVEELRKASVLDKNHSSSKSI